MLLNMSTGRIRDAFRLLCLGLTDVFRGIYHYSQHQTKGNHPKGKASELQIFGWSPLKSTIFWIFIVNGVFFGCSEYLLNLLVLGFVNLGLYVTDYFFADSSEYIWTILSPMFRTVFSYAWIFPMFIISRITNWWWFQDIADITYRTYSKPTASFGITENIADLLCTSLLQVLFFLECGAVSFIPGVGPILSFIHLCLLYSMYAFEYKWCNYGWQLPKRIAFIECNWPYFIGFGLPLAALTSLTNDRVLSIGIFSFLFPVCIISGNNSVPATATQDCRIPIFGVVGYLTNKFFERMLS